MLKISSKTKIILYAFSGFGINLINVAVGTYLCSALLVGGFSETAKRMQTMCGYDLVIPTLWGVFIFIAKVLDGIIDIPFAILIDGYAYKTAKKKLFMLIALSFLVISYVLFLIVPNKELATLQNTIYYGILLCVFYCSYTLLMLTYYSTYSEIVNNNTERRLLSNAKAIFDILYFVVAFVIIKILLEYYNIKTVALMVLPLSLTIVIAFIFIKERKRHVAKNNEKIFNAKILIETLKDKKLIMWMIIYSFITMSIQIFLAGINEYFSIINTNMYLIVGIILLLTPFSLYLYRKALNKYKFIFCLKSTLLLFVFGMSMLYFLEYIKFNIVKIFALILITIFLSLAISVFFSYSYDIPIYFASISRKQKSLNNSAVVFAIQGLFAGISTGIATGVLLIILKETSINGYSAIKFLPVVSAVCAFFPYIMVILFSKKLDSLNDNKEQKGD